MTEHQTATIGLTVIDESGQEAVMHSRCWYVPPDLADGIAASLTLRYGQPYEMIADPDAMAAAGQRTAVEDGTVYMFPEEVPGG